MGKVNILGVNVDKITYDDAVDKVYSMLNEKGNHVTQEFIDYCRPLIEGETHQPKENGLPRFAKLKKVLVK